MNAPCLMTAWSACEAELLGFLRHRVGRIEDAEEVLQEVFIKAMRQGKQFCGLDNPRAWLFQADIEGRSQQELAELLGLSLSGAKSRIQRARRHLRQKMEKGCQVRFDESGSVCGFTQRPPLPSQ